MDGNGQRRALEALLDERGGDYAGLSRLIGKNPAYIQQFVKRGSPRRLAEEDRRTIAEFFGVPAAILGVGDRNGSAFDRNSAAALVRIERLDVGASAGGGAFADDERSFGGIGFDPAWMRAIGANPATHRVILVDGDSMEPSLSDGDQIMVDRAAATAPLREGIHVIRMDGTLMVKRLARAPGGRLSVLSDNPDYPDHSGLDPADIAILGRVVWAGRRM